MADEYHHEVEAWRLRMAEKARDDHAREVDLELQRKQQPEPPRHVRVPEYPMPDYENESQEYRDQPLRVDRRRYP